MRVYELGAPNCGFILSEANGHRSRENGIVVSGAGEVKAGTVVMDNGSGKLTPFTGEESTEFGGANEAVGIVMYNVDATDEDVAVAYIARDAEVNFHGLFYPDASTAHPGEETKANMIASLAQRNIIVRE